MTSKNLPIPRQLTSDALPDTWRRVAALERKPSDVTIDLSELQFIDPEPANHLILITHVLHRAGAKLTIKMPWRDNVLAYLNAIGVVETLERFGTAVAAEHVRERYTRRGGQHFLVPYFAGDHERSVEALARYARSYFFECAADGIADTRAGFLGLPGFYRAFNDDGDLRRVTRCFMELTQNTFDHSGERAGCVTFRLARADKEYKVLLAITDIGIGIKASLAHTLRDTCKTSDDDLAYLTLAVEPGVTRTGFGSRGLGLTEVVRLVDRLDIWSGSGFLSCEKQQRDGKRTAFLPGTSVRATFTIPRQRT